MDNLYCALTGGGLHDCNFCIVGLLADQCLRPFKPVSEGDVYLE